MNNLMENDKGFTLIEIVMVVVVLGILSGFTFAFIRHATTTYSIGAKQRMLYQEASYAMERISRELRDAISVTSGSNLLTMVKPNRPTNVNSMDPSPNVEFRLTGNQLARNTIVMASHVAAFVPTGTCSYASTNCSVTITLTMTDDSIPLPVDAQTVTMVTTITPKNFQPTAPYEGRCFNGDYEDFIQ